MSGEDELPESVYAEDLLEKFLYAFDNLEVWLLRLRGMFAHRLHGNTPESYAQDAYKDYHIYMERRSVDKRFIMDEETYLEKYPVIENNDGWMMFDEEKFAAFRARYADADRMAVLWHAEHAKLINRYLDEL